MIDSFETFAAAMHILWGGIAGYGLASTDKKKKVTCLVLAVGLFLAEAVRFFIMGPS